MHDLLLAFTAAMALLPPGSSVVLETGAYRIAYLGPRLWVWWGAGLISAVDCGREDAPVIARALLERAAAELQAVEADKVLVGEPGADARDPSPVSNGGR